MSPAQLSTLIFIAIFALIVGVRIWRSAREQRFKPATMWIVPGIFAAITTIWAVADGFTSALDIALFVIALAIGGAIGWYQGTHTTIRYDHTIHAMFVKISPIGSMIWVAVLALRFGVRYYFGGLAAATATASNAAGVPSVPTATGPAGLFSMALLVVAVGVIAGLRAYLQRAYTLERASL